MDTRKLSAGVGFGILLGCVVAVVWVIYNNGSYVRTSYSKSVDEYWKKREIWTKGGRKEIPESTRSKPELQNLGREEGSRAGESGVRKDEPNVKERKVQEKRNETTTTPKSTSTVAVTDKPVEIVGVVEGHFDPPSTSGEEYSWEDEEQEENEKGSSSNILLVQAPANLHPTFSLPPPLLMKRVPGNERKADWTSNEGIEGNGPKEIQPDPNNLRDPLTVMRSVLQLVTDVYRRGKEGWVGEFPAFLKVINETVLSQRPLESETSAPVGRQAVESSLPAFVFMSFGVFLLNQIQKLAGKSGGEGGRSGRELGSLSQSELQFLFDPPNSDGRNESETSVMNQEPAISGYGNNVFRAALNLINAYTKGDSALPCIWSHYCLELDKAAREDGSLYATAARINSVGLRLILGQIRKERTVDAVLRSLLQWDGLACTDLFSKCQVVESGGELFLEREKGKEEGKGKGATTEFTIGEKVE